MGQKVHPYSFRLGLSRSWQSRWFAKGKVFARYVVEDAEVRKYIKKTFPTAQVSKIEIERVTERVKVIIHTSRPGIIIGRRGADIDRLREDLQNITQKQVDIELREIKNPALDAQLVAENIAFQLEKRIAYRRAIKRAIQLAMEGGAKGVKIVCGGRLAGAEIARSETFKTGKIPLQTLRADIDYGTCGALTTYGYIGIKVWIYKGDTLLEKNKKEEISAQEKLT
ncbi:MAG: 30S ribosomal protein S3 [Candidatus Omnitrophica bacterium]|nr:30S ribosomal protein S3 [Candidatus Omnitrophota bacterium]MCM8798881.1 30S ribosomal protein S3 [Candidatus Omnitrophota bacterium]